MDHIQEFSNNISLGGVILFTLGAIFLVGLVAHELGKRTGIPRVTILLLTGALASPNALDLVPPIMHSWFPFVSQIALCMVGFLLGEQFVYRTLMKSGKVVWAITVSESLGAALVVFTVLYLLDVPIVVAILLAGIAPASAPAATIDVVKETHVSGDLPKVLLRVVAIDDFFGILIFALCISIVEFLSGTSNFYDELLHSFWEIGGAVLIGCVIGWPMAKLTGRLSKGEPLLIEALGFVLLTGGIAELSGSSYLLASIVLGAMVANFASHHQRPFHAIEGISTPLLIIFFLMAGFQFDITQLHTIGFIGGAYILARSFGLIMGGYIGANLGGADPVVKKYIGWCLLPQAGVALGLALMATEKYPEYSSEILSLLVGTTVIFELFGPVITRFSLINARKYQSSVKQHD